MRVSVEELRARARTPFRLLPDTKTLLHHFARSIADGIQSRNRARRAEPIDSSGGADEALPAAR